jgi:Ca2+-binding RTX toxin-like protein
VANGGSTNDQTLQINGTGEANTTIRVYDGATLLAANVIVAGDGQWSFATQLSNGRHSFTVTDTDAAGNISTASTAFSVTVDTLAPTIAITNEILGNNDKLTLNGTSDTDGTISIADNGVTIGTTTASGGTWSFMTGPHLSDVVHSFVATEIDAAGNQGSNSALLGSSGNDTLSGDSGSNLILGKGGNDTIIGFVGADTIRGSSGTDTILLTATSADLNIAANSQIVNVQIVSAATAASGVVIDLSHQVDGFTIVGSNQSDTIKGSSGADAIKGGGGGDALTGGGGNDTFIYTTTADSKPGLGNFDILSNFTHGSDKIDFSAITSLTTVASATSFPSSIAAHTIEIVTSGGNTAIYANASNASETASSIDMEIHLTGVTHVTSTDIIHH